MEFISRSEERRVGKECRSLCDWSSDVCSSDLIQNHIHTPLFYPPAKAPSLDPYAKRVRLIVYGVHFDDSCLALIRRVPAVFAGSFERVLEALSAVLRGNAESPLGFLNFRFYFLSNHCHTPQRR